MDDWEDLLDDDTQLEVKKEGENFDGEIVQEEKKQESKPVQKKQQKKKEEPKKKDPPKKLTDKEIEEEIKKNQQKEIADMFGLDIAKPLVDIDLKTVDDYKNFAKIISSKLDDAPSRKYIVEFFKELITETESELDQENLTEVQDKLNVVINKKLKEQKGKGKKKKKKGVVVSRAKDYGLYDDYQMDDMDDEDYDGDRGRYDDDDFL